MGHYTRDTARWLDDRYRMRLPDGTYHAHMPIYGLDHPASEPGHAERLARVFQILRTLSGLRFSTLLDVGGGEGWLAHLAARHFGATAMVCDLSAEACARAGDLFGLCGAVVDCARLPFADGSFDVVLCSEVMEHVEFPVESLLELDRVARRAVILTSVEFKLDREEIDRRLFQRCGLPHTDRNLFHPDDLRLVLGQDAEQRPQFTELPPEEPLTEDGTRAWIARATAGVELARETLGVILLKTMTPEARRETPLHTDEALLDRLFTDSQIAARPLPPRARRPSKLDTFNRRLPDPTAAELADRLRHLWPDDDDRIAGALQLRARLALDSDPDKAQWDFATVEDRRGWLPSESLTERPGDGSGLHYTAEDDDPWLAGPPLSIRADRLASIDITMRIHNPAHPVDAGVGQVFWMREDDRGLDERRSVTFPVLNDGERHTYRVDVRQSGEWPDSGRILFVRIDPVNGPCEIDVFGVALTARPAAD